MMQILESFSKKLSHKSDFEEVVLILKTHN